MYKKDIFAGYYFGYRLYCVNFPYYLSLHYLTHSDNVIRGQNEYYLNLNTYRWQIPKVNFVMKINLVISNQSLLL